MKVESLDFVYMPSRDPAAELDYFERVLGWRVVFAIEAYGTRVAMLQPSEAPPAVLLAGHLEGERPVLVYRVESLEAAVAELEAEGGEAGPELGIPHGPIHEVELPGGHRMAVYELTRPGAAAHLEGRRDF
jgi:catechol 2,3-dioxygenase-like lactoylglutathione lyase family enzyme